MTTISAPRPSHKRPHISSPLKTQPDDPSSKRQKTPDSRGPPLPADFFDTTSSTTIPTILPIGGQNRAPLSMPKSEPPITTDIDENEWAAFEADIAETEATISTTAITIPSSAVISAAPTGPDGTLSTEDSEAREDEVALDREDAQNKLVQEFEEMESLESRVQRLKEQREALRAKAAESVGERMDLTINRGGEDEDEDEDEDVDEEEDWIHFSK
ncbi:hypothetical protein EV426DRAFT_643137 [Tirmania nivea]|nr:hypothetical protein EV426DRAFT_643137 [Tirmania nivea]